ncbi:MAG: transporter, partial [Rhizomicrobium sp.]
EPVQVAQANSGETRRTTNPPQGPVGEAPKKDESPPQVVQSLPEGLAVLTARNHFVVTPSAEYTTTTNDRLVFRGVVIVPGINLGEVDASTDARNILSSVIDLRYGITNRLEIEARLPYVWSDDRATVLTQGPNASATQSLYLQDSGIGDVEIGARYQINSGLDDWPIFIGNARFKADTGMGPFDIKRDSAGIAQQVALGSGFMGVSGGFSVLKVTDPAVLFGSVNYVYNISKDINQNIGNVFVGRVDPSNTINANLGFGFAINPEFSFSFGYEHSYVMPQTTMLGTTRQETTSLQVGALTMGMAYRLNNNTSLNGNFEFGVTAAAPDMRAVFSLPMNF